MEKKYKVFTLRNFREIPQIKKLPASLLNEIETVAHVFPFKTNNYVINHLIDWDNIPEDPMFVLNFPQRDMLLPHDFATIYSLLKQGGDEKLIKDAVNQIRLRLNPHPAGQLDLNVPIKNGRRLEGIQHKYRETVLFFPSQGQTCHAYCTFCFRWPQFTGMDEMRFASREASMLTGYLRSKPGVTNVLFTGGDPLTMKSSLLAKYIEPLLSPEFDHIHTIRLGTKALSYWPYRFTTDADSDELMRLFQKVFQAGKHLTIMAHFNHPVELDTVETKNAIERLRNVNVEIRTQSPLLRHINDNEDIWAEMWRKQVSLGCIPYYMFLARDTGAHHYFSVKLEEAYEIYRKAYIQVSGVARTVRGPVMSASPGKVQVLGLTEIHGEKLFVLQFLQGRNPDWVRKPFFASYNFHATWIDELKPAFGEQNFFWQKEYEQLYNQHKYSLTHKEDF
ncbi:MAG: lysine 2,3-aminomutase [Bacteroidetes bacterium]|nr:lysine 2,3-aminomutase [Bacteroidota bacterium]